MDFSNLFRQFTAEDSVFLLIVMLVAFLLGILLGYVLRSRRVIQLNRELKEKKKELDEARAEVESLQEQLGLKEADLKKLGFSTQEAEARAERLEEEKEQLHKEIFLLNRQLEEGGSSDDSYQTTIEELNAEIEQLRTKNQELVAALNAEQQPEDNLAQMQSTFNATRQRLEAVERRLDELAAENAQLHEKWQGVRAIGPGVVAAAQSGANEAALPEIHPMPGLPDAELIEEEPEPNFNPEKSILHDKLPSDEEGDKDELSRIEGVGPFLQQQLYDIGVSTFEEISTWDSEKIAEVTRKIGYFEGRIEKDRWVEQAAQLAVEKQQMPEGDAPVAPLSTDPTDLAILEGLDEQAAQTLQSAGIERWEQLAESSAEQLQDILEASGRPELVPVSGSWPTQARLAQNGDWAVLREYQAELRSA